MIAKTKKDKRIRRHRRVRRKVSGTAERPRMAVAKSDRHLYVQFVDDERAVTLAAVSTLGGGPSGNVAAAAALGKKAAEAAVAKGIKRVVVDRGGFKYHGRIKAIVEAAREAGLSTVSEEKQ